LQNRHYEDEQEEGNFMHSLWMSPSGGSSVDEDRSVCCCSLAFEPESR